MAGVGGSNTRAGRRTPDSIVITSDGKSAIYFASAKMYTDGWAMPRGLDFKGAMLYKIDLRSNKVTALTPKLGYSLKTCKSCTNPEWYRKGEYRIGTSYPGFVYANKNVLNLHALLHALSHTSPCMAVCTVSQIVHCCSLYCI